MLPDAELGSSLLRLILFRDLDLVVLLDAYDVSPSEASSSAERVLDLFGLWEASRLGGVSSSSARKAATYRSGKRSCLALGLLRGART